jgi:hypothetical protein
LKAIEENYGDQVKVIFLMLTAEQKLFGEIWNKVNSKARFLDENGNEFFRHEDFIRKGN